MKQLIKRIVYHVGIFSLFHRFRNKNTLTILMLHRVLPKEQAAALGSDPEWTITPTLLDNLVCFAKTHYSIISLSQLQEYQNSDNGFKLPDRPLLFSFDDGWRDNFDYALPVLEKHNIPVVLHQISDCVDNRLLLWQEQLSIIHKKDDALYEQLSMYFFSMQVSIDKFINEIEKDTDKACELTLLIEQRKPEAKKMMLDQEELKRMLKSCFELSSHGKTHRKLNRLSEEQVISELQLSSQALSEISGGPITSISFPHGGVNKKVIDAAQMGGYKTLFTSEPTLNQISKNRSTWGRVHIAQSLVCEGDKFSPQKMAYLLFNREISRVN